MWHTARRDDSYARSHEFLVYRATRGRHATDGFVGINDGVGKRVQCLSSRIVALYNLHRGS